MFYIVFFGGGGVQGATRNGISTGARFQKTGANKKSDASHWRQKAGAKKLAPNLKTGAKKLAPVGGGGGGRNAPTRARKKKQ